MFENMCLIKNLCPSRIYKELPELYDSNVDNWAGVYSVVECVAHGVLVLDSIPAPKLGGEQT